MHICASFAATSFASFTDFGIISHVRHTKTKAKPFQLFVSQHLCERAQFPARVRCGMHSLWSTIIRMAHMYNTCHMPPAVCLRSTASWHFSFYAFSLCKWFARFVSAALAAFICISCRWSFLRFFHAVALLRASNKPPLRCDAIVILPLRWRVSDSGSLFGGDVVVGNSERLPCSLRSLSARSSHRKSCCLNCTNGFDKKKKCIIHKYVCMYICLSNRVGARSPWYTCL